MDIRSGDRQEWAVDAISYAFQEDKIGLDMDATVKLNCDEAK